MDTMKKTLSLISLLLLASGALIAQKSLLQSGPMAGYSEMREVLLWVQTKEPATVQFSYWPQADPKKVFYTDKYQTAKAEAHTARLLADQTEPGTRYDYQVWINGQAVKLDYPATFQTQVLWQWRTDPPDFRFATGSCAYINETVYDRPGRPYGGEYEVFQSIHAQKPDMMLWLGDNIYLREVDWNSWTGIVKRYTHARSLPEMQPLLASTHHYAIWDDHDFGPNDSDRSFIHKDKALEAFKLFWGNPTYGLPDVKGTTSFFQWADMDFFLLDNRYHKTPNERKTGERTMFGKEQLEWLIDALAYSQAPFKFVATGGLVLNPNPGGEKMSSAAPEERAWLLRRIEEEGIKNVIFLTGDVHYTELSTMKLGNGEPVYEFTVSPISSGVSSWPANNPYQVEGTEVRVRNFATIDVSGPRKERKLTLRVFNAKGEELWTRVIEQAP
jgi:alkaline phosphatase D